MVREDGGSDPASYPIAAPYGWAAKFGQNEIRAFCSFASERSAQASSRMKRFQRLFRSLPKLEIAYRLIAVTPPQRGGRLGGLPTQGVAPLCPGL